MDIQQFYQQSAIASLNASLAAFIPSIAILIYAFFITQFYQLIILIIPFLIYSFFCYQKYLINQNRAKAVKLSTTDNECAQKVYEKKLLLGFMPAPSLRLLFFTPDGMKAGEIRDDSFLLIRWFIPPFIDRLFKKKYILYDDAGQPIAYYHDYKDRIMIIPSDNRGIAVIYKVKHGKKKEFLYGNNGIFIKDSSFQDYSFYLNDKTLIAHIQTGWMPLEWGERFVDSNTPILSMKQELTDFEVIQLYSLLVHLYKYGNH